MLCPKCKSNNIAGNHLQFECCNCGEIWSPLDEEKDEITDNQIWNPMPRFERINKGFCPDCDARLDNTGGCLDCHIVPALDPEFQQWLSGGETYSHKWTATLTAPAELSPAELSHWHRRAAELLGQPVTIATG